MLFSKLSATIATTLFVVASTALSTIDADGIYVSYENQAGVVHEKISGPLTNITNSPTSETSPTSRKHKRGISNASFCGCGFTVDPGYTDAANEDLKAQLNRQPNGKLYLQKKYCYYSVRGSVVAFVCNQYEVNGKDWGQWFTARYVDEDNAVITGDCGRYIAGTYAWGYYPSFISGYMRWTPGMDIIKAALSSTALSC
jgi:hypothetical protein